MLYCKAWILGVAAMQLLAYDPTHSELPEREGTREILRCLLEASAAAGGVAPRTRAGVPAISQLRSTLLTALTDIHALTSRDLSSGWAGEQVCYMLCCDLPPHPTPPPSPTQLLRGLTAGSCNFATPMTIGLDGAAVTRAGLWLGSIYRILMISPLLWEFSPRIPMWL